MIKKYLKKKKIFEWPVLPYRSFSPIDYSVMKPFSERFSKFVIPIINILIIRQAISL